MENITQMRKRHEKEIEQLQKSCNHEKSKRMPYMWAPGHLGNDVEVCSFCGKILKTYGTISTSSVSFLSIASSSIQE